jgi:dTDP-6-deoxy-L-talose 4-dehydrogenase [NAD(P)+]
VADVLRRTRPDVVVNAAGCVWDPQGVDSANVHLVEHLVAALSTTDIRLIHLGSAHEYAESPSGAAIDETFRADPRTPYGQAKLKATSLVSPTGLALRLSNVVGPLPSPQGLLGITVRRLAEAINTGEPATIRLTSDRAHRDFVDVLDVADAVIAAAASTTTGVLNIGSGTATGIRELVQQLIDISGAPAKIEITAPPAGQSLRETGDWQLLDIAAAGRVLGWTPTRTLADSLRAVWASRPALDLSSPAQAQDGGNPSG